MKTEALVLVEQGKIETTEINLPDPGPGELLVEVKANGICRGDIALFTGQLNNGYPLFHGHEPAGIVAEVGPQVEDFKPGDRVALLASPSYRRYCVAKAARAIKIPDQPADLALWVSEPVACAVNGVHGSNFRAGDKVALIGCGYMGLLILQGMPREILGRLIVADPDPSRRALAEGLGARETYDPTQTDLVELAQEIGGFDVVIEASGAKGTLLTSTDMVRRGGVLNIFAWHHGETTVPTTKWHLKGLRVLNTAPGFAEDFGICFRGAIALLGTGRIDQQRLISHRFPMAQAQQAFELAAGRKDGYIKGVITF